jgi:hypothetical protein
MSAPDTTPKAWCELLEEFHCDGRELWFNRRVEPPSWVLADEVIAAGAKGIVFASTLGSGGLNGVVYNDMLAPPAIACRWSTQPVHCRRIRPRGAEARDDRLN